MDPVATRRRHSAQFRVFLRLRSALSKRTAWAAYQERVEGLEAGQRVDLNSLRSGGELALPYPKVESKGALSF
jgi:hypothetical protein